MAPAAARIVLALEEPGFAGRAATELTRRGYDAIAVEDSMAALNVLDAPARTDLLVTCEHFAPGKPTGLSLARMALYRHRLTKVLFVGSRELAAHTDGLGVFMPSPVTEQQVLDKAIQMLSPDYRTPAPKWRDPR